MSDRPTLTTHTVQAPCHAHRSDRLWPFITAIAIAVLLGSVQLAVPSPLLLAERWLPGGGWIQVVLAAIAGGWLYDRMQAIHTRSLWRKRIWLLFTVVFFTQLILGIWIDPIFLLSGELHFPIPGIILGGALYRWQIGFMPILFLVTVCLSGGAWCHQLCYFGALDALAAGNKPSISRISSQKRQQIRLGILGLFILSALILRFSGVSALWATVGASIVGLLGIAVILFVSYKQKRMVHCSLYCPLGTLVTYLKEVSPWRFQITASCTQCFHCTRYCPYGALTLSDIKLRKIGHSCTLCGDCLPHCPHNALTYKFPGLNNDTAQRLWLCVCTTLYMCFLMLARI